MPVGSVVVVSGDRRVVRFIARIAQRRFSFTSAPARTLEDLTLESGSAAWVDFAGGDPIVRAAELPWCNPQTLAAVCADEGVPAVVIAREIQMLRIYFRGRLVATFELPDD
jgi:hypothetical protein